LTRRATLVKRERVDRPQLLLLDGGNTLWGDAGLAAQTQGRVMVEAMNLMGYSAMALGELDLQLGADALRERMAEASFPFLSANLVINSTGQLLARPYVLLDAGGRQVAVIGLTGSGSVPTAPGEQAPLEEPLSPWDGSDQPVDVPRSRQRAPLGGPAHVIGALAVTDPAHALSKALYALRWRTDVIIVLSNLGWEANARLAQSVRGLDLVVSAGPGQLMASPWRAPGTGTPVAQCGVYPQQQPGSLLGKVRLHVDSAGAVDRCFGSHTALSSQIVGDVEMRDLLRRFQKLCVHPRESA
jgi:2',3'-cyclic-nucleotide 2'-phosphodiesterase (5'-nucleotidase family)